ncbi:MAG: ABC transporter permease, partial [Bryobacteraceae bacterium]
MRISTLIVRNLKYYWRTNLAVVAGVAIAVSVLAGASLVGESVRASLRSLFLERIGKTDDVVTSSGFFREELAASFPAACPMIVLEGLVIQQSGGRRSSHVAVYGVDQRFWKFHERAGQAPSGRQALLSEALAAEIGIKAGESVLVRVEKPSAIPAEWLHGRKEETSSAMRFTVRQVLSAAELGDFSLRPQQGGVRAIFLPLPRVQKELEQEKKINVILTHGTPPEQKLRETFTLADLGLKSRLVDEGRSLSIESDSAVLNDILAAGTTATAAAMDLRAKPVFTYLSNSIRIGGKEIPYSLVSALDLQA